MIFRFTDLIYYAHTQSTRLHTICVYLCIICSYYNTHNISQWIVRSSTNNYRFLKILKLNLNEFLKSTLQLTIMKCKVKLLENMFIHNNHDDRLRDNYIWENDPEKHVRLACTKYYIMQSTKTEKKWIENKFIKMLDA